MAETTTSLWYKGHSYDADSFRVLACNAVDDDVSVPDDAAGTDYVTPTELAIPPQTTPVAYYSMDEVPEIPDDPAGVMYLQDAWNTTDSWSDSRSTLSVSNGALRATIKSGQDIISMARALGTDSYGKIIRIRAKCSNPNCYPSSVAGGGSAWGIYVNKTGNPNTEWNIWETVVLQSDLSVSVYTSPGVPGDYIDLDCIYIGTGAYLPGSVLDNSGHGNHGTAFAVTPVAGISGNGLQFIKQSYATFKSGTGVFGSSDYAVSAWIKRTGEVFLFLISNRSGDYSNGYGVSGSGDLIQAYFISHTPDIELSSPAYSLSLNVWHHVMIRRSHARNALELCVDGAQRAAIDLTGYNNAQDANYFNLNTFAGLAGDSYHGENYELDEIALYNYCPDDSKLLGLYQSKSLISGPIARYDMDEVPDIPDDPEGTVYVQDEWATLDGWSYGGWSADSSLAIAASLAGNRLVLIVQSSSSVSSYFRMTRNFSSFSGKHIRFRVKKNMPGNLTLYGTINNVNDTPIKILDIPLADTDYVFDFLVPGAVTNLFINANNESGFTVGNYFSVDWFYVGTGAYLPGSVLDNSGHGNHGQAFAVTPVAGISGNGLDFNTTGFFQIPSRVKVDGQAMSVSIWAYQKSHAEYQTLMCCRYGSLYNWMLYTHTTDGSLQLHGKEQYKSTYIPPLNTWLHIVAIVSTTGEVKIYVNGELVINFSGYLYHSDTLLYGGIGGWVAGSGSSVLEGFNGYLDEAAIYDRELSAQEVLGLYQGNTYKSKMSPHPYSMISYKNSLLGSDNTITETEKTSIKSYWAKKNSAYDTIVRKASFDEVDHTSLTTARNALYNYLFTNPAVLETSGDVSIDSATYSALWSTFDTQYSALSDAIDMEENVLVTENLFRLTNCTLSVVNNKMRFTSKGDGAFGFVFTGDKYTSLPVGTSIRFSTTLISGTADHSWVGDELNSSWSHTFDIHNYESKNTTLGGRLDRLYLGYIGSTAGAVVELGYLYIGNGNWKPESSKTIGKKVQLCIHPTTKQLGFFENSIFTPYASNAIIEDDTKCHICLMVKDSKATLYLNGKVVCTDLSTFSEVDYPINKIGNYYPSEMSFKRGLAPSITLKPSATLAPSNTVLSNTTHANGWVDEVRTYDRILSPADIEGIIYHTLLQE